MPESKDSVCERHREFVPLIAAVERVEDRSGRARRRSGPT